jgi:class 3 adenylate cyclase
MMCVVEMDGTLEAARVALSKHSWPEAFELLARASGTADLDPEDLEGLAKAAWWTGHPNASIEARERAYAGYVSRGQTDRAAFMALTLRREYMAKLSGSIAGGWLDRAESLLRDSPESASHGYLALAHAESAWGGGELDEALAEVERAAGIAGRSQDRDLIAWAVMREGMIRVDRGEVDEGWKLMQEVSAAAVGGELGPYTTGAVFCNVISMCRDLADYARASEWGDAAKRWCERQAITGFPGVCRVHRAEVMRLVGSWAEAETEVRRACDELVDFHPAIAGEAFHELGELRLRMGDLTGADDAFIRSRELGQDPQPGQALLLLAGGKADAAAASIRRSLEDLTWERLARARLLPAQASIALASGDVETALAAADELGEIAAEFGTSALRANAETARGIASLLKSDGESAVRSLRSARRIWHEVDAPYEAATTAVLLARAYGSVGDDAAAGQELASAGAAFGRLGATLDAQRSEALAARLGAGHSRRVTRTFVFTDIVGSTALIGAIGDDAWRDLRRWHDETLRSAFVDHGGEEIDHAGDGFFVAFPDAPAALACAIDVQRRLQEHRARHGFAPAVRIGLHAAEATRSEGDYLGGGVHAAARIGALAGGGEIVASARSLEGIEATTSDPHEVTLKGIASPIDVVAVDWRSS